MYKKFGNFGKKWVKKLGEKKAEKTRKKSRKNGEIFGKMGKNWDTASPKIVGKKPKIGGGDSQNKFLKILFKDWGGEGGEDKT